MSAAGVDISAIDASIMKFQKQKKGPGNAPGLCGLQRR
jgi:hypothetical protein